MFLRRQAGVAVRSHRDHGRDQRIKTARQQKCRIRGQNDTPLLALSSSLCWIVAQRAGFHWMPLQRQTWTRGASKIIITYTEKHRRVLGKRTFSVTLETFHLKII